MTLTHGLSHLTGIYRSFRTFGMYEFCASKTILELH